MSGRLLVRLKAPKEPLLLGQVAEIEWFDYVPFCLVSEQNPTVYLKFPSGHRMSAELRDCEFVGRG